MQLRLLFLVLLGLLVTRLAAADDSRAQIKALIDGRHWAAAQPLLEKRLAAEPQDAEANYSLGLALHFQNKPLEAVPRFEKAAELAPANSEYQRMLAESCGAAAMQSSMLSRLGWAGKCKAAYLKAVELDPKNINARLGLLEFYRQAPRLVGGGIDLAYAQAEAIRQLDPETGRRAYASLYVAEKKFAEAFGLYDEILKATPDDYDALFQLGRLSALSGQQLDRGLASLRRCLQLTPPAKYRTQAAAQWRIGTILEKQGDKPGALAAYGQAVGLDPKFGPAAESLQKLKGS